MDIKFGTIIRYIHDRDEEGRASKYEMNSSVTGVGGNDW